MSQGQEASINTPLLGGSRQTPQAPLYKNLFLDFALLAQAGILIVFIIIWFHILSHDLILFSAHPLLQSLALLVLTQAILILQPTHSGPQKHSGARAHAALNLASFCLLVAGVTVIEVNKFRGHGPHFHSVHGTLGILTSIAILLQYVVGFTAYATPALYGGVDNAKKLYRYHRGFGYFVYLALLATVLSAVWTDYNRNVLGLKWWQLAAPGALILPIYLRINVAKFGFGSKQAPAAQEDEEREDARQE